MFATWGLLLLPALAAALAAAWRRRCDQSLVPGAALLALVVVSCLPYTAVGLGAPLVAPSHGSSSPSALLAAAGAGPLPVTVWYGGWAPRHMLLAMVPMTWLLVWLAGFARHRGAVLAASLILLLAFAVPGHVAKLSRIAQEAALVQLLRSVPPPPPGKLDLLLARPYDSLNLLYESHALLDRAYGRQAWAALMGPDHPGVQPMLEDIREHALSSRLPEQLVRSQQLMHGYDRGRTCRTVTRVELPRPAAADLLWRAEHAPATLPSARFLSSVSDCPDAVAPWR